MEMLSRECTNSWCRSQGDRRENKRKDRPGLIKGSCLVMDFAKGDSKKKGGVLKGRLDSATPCQVKL